MSDASSSDCTITLTSRTLWSVRALCEAQAQLNVIIWFAFSSRHPPPAQTCFATLLSSTSRAHFQDCLHILKTVGTVSCCCLCATFCCCHAHEHHLLTLPNLQGQAPAAVCVPLFAVATLTNTICSHFQNCRGKLQLLFVGHFMLLPRSRTPSAHTSKTAGASSSCCLWATFCCCHAHEHHLLTLPKLQGQAPAADV